MGESRRQDKLVKSETLNATISSISSLVINLAVVVGTVAGFVITNNPAAFMALSIPGFSIVANVVVDIKGKKEN